VEKKVLAGGVICDHKQGVEDAPAKARQARKSVWRKLRGRRKFLSPEG
jgi:hypothetical protein